MSIAVGAAGLEGVVVVDVFVGVVLVDVLVGVVFGDVLVGVGVVVDGTVKVGVELCGIVGIDGIAGVLVVGVLVVGVDVVGVVGVVAGGANAGGGVTAGAVGTDAWSFCWGTGVALGPGALLASWLASSDSAA
jgi:hypothetical protein